MNAEEQKIAEQAFFDKTIQHLMTQGCRATIENGRIGVGCGAVYQPTQRTYEDYL